MLDGHFGRGPLDRHAGCGVADEGDAFDFRVSDDGLAGCRTAGHDIDDPCWQHIVHNLTEHTGRQRAGFAGFDDDRVAGDDCAGQAGTRQTRRGG